MLAEQHDEWAEGRRYVALEVRKRARLTTVPEPDITTPEDAPNNNVPALSA